MENLKIYVVTYNVATVFPDLRINLRRLLGFDNRTEETTQPDVYVIGCQEVKSQPQNYVYDSFFDDPWAALFKRTLAPRGYVRLRAVRLQGIVLSVYVLRPHVVRVREVEDKYIRLGLGGMWGNKGAVALRLSLMGVSLCLVNCHLTAHDHLLPERLRNYCDIVDQTNFQDPATRKLFYHDYLIWLGDLNFRLAGGESGAPEDEAVRRMAAEHDLTPLLELDQLRWARATGQAFSELAEPTITFKPTYKLVPGRRSEYAESRRPAWTDRILYKVNPDVYEEAQLSIEPLSYQSHPEYSLSDHQPVSAEFNIKVFSDRPLPCVEFLPISQWLVGADCVAKYRRDHALDISGWDWIALFRADFASLDEYVSYIWAPRTTSSPNSDHYVAVFPEDSVTMPGTYVLLYFGRNGRGVYGVSEPFSVQYSHSLRRAAAGGAGAVEERRPLLEAEGTREEHPLVEAADIRAEDAVLETLESPDGLPPPRGEHAVEDRPLPGAECSQEERPPLN